MEIEVPVKTKANTLAVVQAYAHINTLNKVVADHLLYAGSNVSSSAGQKRCLHTDTQLQIEFETRESRSVGRDIR